ncbi:MAG: hypothetical protein H7A51_11735 [Akkermansiaceae bacterium]|nr:hypothetical protein [Akkermansiaceae bacterium]
MKTTTMRPAFYAFMILMLPSFCLADAKDENQVFRSPNGFTATFIGQKGEGPGATIIKNKDGKEVARIASVYPMSFSPVADILLVKECAADDDIRQYVLNIGAGEYQKKGRRTDYVFGGRYVMSAKWSKDGKTITLVNRPGLADLAEETFNVAELLKGK